MYHFVALRNGMGLGRGSKTIKIALRNKFKTPWYGFVNKNGFLKSFKVRSGNERTIDSSIPHSTASIRQDVRSFT